jgi:hypothetical protein
MRNILYLICLLMIHYNLFSVDIYASDTYDTIRITDTIMKVEYADN